MGHSATKGSAVTCPSLGRFATLESRLRGPAKLTDEVKATENSKMIAETIDSVS